MVTGGQVGAAIDRFLSRATAQLDARLAEAKRWGGSATYGDSRKIVGVQFDSDQKPPEGWVTKGPAGVFAPSRRTKEGREIFKRWTTMRLDGAAELQDEVMGKDEGLRFMDFPSIRYITFERIGDAIILKVPNIGNPWKPPDARCAEIPTSEYWCLKEDQDQLS